MAAADHTSNLSQNLEPILKDILAIAEQNSGNGEALLGLLRQLESIHRQICEEKFYPTLPERRRDLYNLLRDMEEEGGWPYIPRPKIKVMLEALLKAEETIAAGDGVDDDIS